MKIVRTVLILVFLLSLGLFGVTEFVSYTGRDTTMPEISSDREILELSCDYTEDQLLEGLTASDEKDGDLTSRIIPGPLSRFIDTGVCNVTYVVFDSAEHPAQLTRQVRFTDYHPPRFSLTQPLVFGEGEGSYTESMSRLSASDPLDGDLTEWISRTDMDINYQTAGDYTMTVEVSSSLGASSTLALPVHVVKQENLSVQIGLTAGIVYLAAGEALDPGAYLAEVTDSEGNPMDLSAVSASSDINTAEPGTYEVHYEATDEAGNYGETWLTVVVEG